MNVEGGGEGVGDRTNPDDSDNMWYSLLVPWERKAVVPKREGAYLFLIPRRLSFQNEKEVTYSCSQEDVALKKRRRSLILVPKET